jgi:putative endonuclease
MSHTKKIGQIGEDLGCTFLMKRGFAIVDRNYWKPWGEIDIVAQKGNDLRFVEVKTVVRDHLPVSREAKVGESDDDYEPEDNLHPWKRKRLRRTIETYLLDKDLDDEIDWQVNALSVYVNREGSLLKIELLEDLIL